MTSRHLRHIVQGLIRLTAAVVLLGLVAFFAATRTQVGRDRVARQIEASVSSRFAGTLHIGDMTGNLAQTLFATNIIFEDPQGRTVLRVDSVVASPRWTALLRREFSIGTLEIFGLAATLYPGESDPGAKRLATSSLQDAFVVTDSSRAPAPGSGSWSMTGASIRISGASIRAGNTPVADAPAVPGWTTWLAEHPVDEMDIKLDVAWTASRKQIDILRWDTMFPEQGLSTSDVRAQVRVDEERISVPDAALRLGSSTLRVAGHVTRGDDAPRFQLEITPSILQTNELHLLAEVIPARGQVETGAMIQGSVGDLTIPWLDISHGASSVHAEGTIIGLPDAADFELSVRSDLLELDEIRSWAPGSDILQDSTVPSVSLDTYFRGQIPSLDSLRNDPFSGWAANGNVDVISDAGSVALSFDINALSTETTLHTLRARTDALDLGPWLGHHALRTRLTGTFSATGSGLHPDNLTSSVFLQLNAPRWNDSRLQRLTASADRTPRGWSGEAILSEQEGSVKMTAAWERGSTVRLSGQVEQMDIGRLLGRDTWQSQLTLDLEGDFTPSWNDSSRFDITVNLDSSWVAERGVRHDVMPQEISARFTPPSTGSLTDVFQLSSPSLRIWIRSEAPLFAAMPALSHWSAVAQEAAARAGNKWLDPGGRIRNLEALLDRSAETLFLARQFDLETSGQSPVSLQLGADITDASLLSALRPAGDSLSLSGRAELDLVVGPDSISVVSTGQFSHVRLGTSTFHGLQTAWSAASARANTATASLPRRAKGHLDVQIDSLSVSFLSAGHTRLTGSIEQNTGGLELHMQQPGLTDSLHVAAAVELQPGFNRVRIEALHLHAGPSEWFLKAPASIDFFADATRVEELQVALRDEAGLTEQSFSAAGTFSAYPDDILRVRAGDLLVTDLSDYFAVRKRIGGRLNASIDLAGGYTQPRASGQIRLDNASLERHIVGNVIVESDFESDSPDLDFSLRIEPIEADSVYISGRDELGEIVENELSLAGMVRLPGRQSASEGQLNLDADLEHVNLFFLEYIFNQAIANVDGFLVGDGRITGTVFQPIIEGRAAALDGTFDIPRTGLTYALEGEMRVDREAIHFERALARDGQDGSALVTGRMNFNNYREFTLDLEGTLDEFQIIGSDVANDLPFYGFIWASGTITLDGPLYDAMLRSTDAVTRPDSRLFIPIEETISETDESFIVFENTPGVIPDFDSLARRPFLLARRPTAERQFLDALNMDLSIRAPTGSIVHLVIDPLLGDVIEASSEGTIQLVREEGEFSVFGTLGVNAGKYLFTAGEVFQRNFQISEGGTMTWDGDPLNATLDINASYRTRASLRGLDNTDDDSRLVPMIVRLHITGTVFSPAVDLSLAIDQSNQNVLGNNQALEARLNQPELATEYATSVLLTNSFILTTDNISSDSGGQLAFNSVSQLVSSQLNRFLNAALPNVDFSFGLQGENTQDLDVTYGVALRLLDERLIIRGEGVYQGARSSNDIRANDGLQGEFVVEVRLNPNVSLEVFFRREGDILQSTELTNTGGIGISYQTEFTGWRQLFSGPPASPE